MTRTGASTRALDDAVVARPRRHARVNVVGTSGSGKSHFARRLAAALGTVHIEMDALYWGPGWEGRPEPVFLESLGRTLARDTWVLDGNYTRTTPVKWARVECVVWLDYSLAVTMGRSIRRAIGRSLSGKELWPGTGNRETLRMSFLSTDSVVLWALRHHRSNRRKYAAMMSDSAYGHIEFVRLRSPDLADRYLASVHARA